MVNWRFGVFFLSEEWVQSGGIDSRGGGGGFDHRVLLECMLGRGSTDHRPCNGFSCFGCAVETTGVIFLDWSGFGRVCGGNNVMEAADIGALFSVQFAAFVMYRSLCETESSALMRVARGFWRTIVVAGCAGFVASYAVFTLVGEIGRAH